jgi:hypothetical protein
VKQKLKVGTEYVLRGSFLVVVLLLQPTCRPVTRTDATGPTATSVVVSAPTATLAPPATLDETASAEATPAPSEESANEQGFGELGPPPDGWERYTSTRWGVSFAVPAVWQEEEADRFVGEDGFARLERFAGPGLSVDQACEWEANFHRERYGSEPGLQSLAWENTIYFKGFPCLILGSPNHSSEFRSAILLPNPLREGRSRFLILEVDTAHAETVARSLSYRYHVTPQPTLSGNSYLAAPGPEEVPDNLPVQTSHFGEMILEEYAVIDGRVDGPGHLEFFQRIPPAVLEKRRAWREAEPVESYLDPVEVGEERVTVEADPYGEFQMHGGVGSSMYVSVQKNGIEVYRYNMLSHAGVFPLYYLGNWDGQWVLEANGMLIVDGKIVNQDWGYDEIFGAQLLNEKPFYFFVQNGETHVAYHRQVLPMAYDYVFHGMCCEPAVFNVAGSGKMVWFYALRDGVWHYVEMGVYD